MAFITVSNNGPEITGTDYWESEYAKLGIVACSMNAGTFRLLLPDWIRDYGTPDEAVEEMRTGKSVIIEKRRVAGKGDMYRAYDFVFDDDTSSPYSITLGENQMLSLQPADTEDGKRCRVVVYTRGLIKAYEADAVLRVTG